MNIAQNNAYLYLSKDIFFEIASHLSPLEFIVIRSICKLWRDLSENEDTWRRYSKSKWPEFVKLECINWKEHFQTNFKGSFYHSLNNYGTNLLFAKNNRIYIFDPENNSHSKLKTSHLGSINQIIVYKDAELDHFITCGSDGYINIWNDNNSKEASFTQKIHTAGVSCIGLLNGLLFSGSFDCSLKIWKLTTERKEEKIPYALDLIDEFKKLPNPIAILKIDNEGFYTGSKDATINHMKLDSQNKIILNQILKGHQATITALKINNRTNCLISGSVDKTIKIWTKNQRNLYECAQTLEFHQSTITAFIADPLSYFLLSTSLDGNIAVWRYSDKNKKWTYESSKNKESAEMHDLKFLQKRAMFHNYNHFYSLLSTGKIAVWTFSK